jgi:hypothetical protein
MFGPRLKPCMMVGYTHDSKSLWRIWDPEFQRVKTQSEVVFDEERNADMSCPHGSNEIDMLDYQKMRNMSKRQIPEMSLSEIVNLRR